MRVHVTVLTLLAFSLPPAAAAQTRTAADYMAAVEGSKSPAGPNGLGGLTIAELMARFNVPGVSIAVIRDHQVHWAKGYGIADVATDAPGQHRDDAPGGIDAQTGGGDGGAASCPRFAVGAPTALFSEAPFRGASAYSMATLAVTPDDKRFVLLRQLVEPGVAGRPELERLLQITNWMREVEAKLAKRRP